MSQDVEYQVGGEQIDESPNVTGDDDNVVKFDYETSAVFRRLADDIYETPEAGIREPLTNSITTVRRIFDNANSDDGVIKISVQDGDRVKLRIRDNGEGIPKPILEKVLTVIGRSNARDDGDLSGMYGMGFLACYKLVGMSGGFLMSTNPRDSKYEPYSGYFKPGVFEYSDDESNNILEDDDYGTLFEFYVREDITVNAISDWVEKHAKWSPVPVIYNEYDENGDLRDNEDYCSPCLNELYEDVPSIHIENDYFEVATSPAAESDIVLISSPVSMRGTRTLRKNLPWSVDMRLKYENGVIFRGPNKGLVPTTKKNYESLSDKRKEKYIPKSELDDKDMTLPEPTGTREKLRKDREFLSYVNDILVDEYVDIAEKTLDGFDPKNDNLKDLDDMERHIIMRLLKQFDSDDEYEKDKIKKELKDTVDYNPDEELTEFFQMMTKNVSVISESKTGRKYPRSRGYKLNETDKKVFMTVSNSSSWKSELVDDHSDHSIVMVDESADYESFSKHLGWTPLKEIKKDNASEILGINEDTVEQIRGTKSNSADNIEDKKLTVHKGSGGRNTIKKTIDYLISQFNRRKPRFGDYMVLFPRGSGKNVSDNYYLADHRCVIASCSKKVKEKLTESDRIFTFDGYIDAVLKKKVISNRGEIEIGQLIQNGYSTVFHIVKENGKVTKNKEVAEALCEEVSNYNSNVSDGSDFAMINKKDWRHLLNVYHEIDTDNDIIESKGRYNTPYTYGSADKTCRSNTGKMYVRNKLGKEFMSSKEYKSMKSDHVNTQLIRTVKLLEQSQEENGLASDNGIETSRNKNNIKLPKHKTKDGNLNIKEIYNIYDPNKVIYHVVQKEKLSTFRTDEFLNQGANRLSGFKFGDYSISESVEGGIYIPILESKYDIIEEYIKAETTVIGVRKYGDENYINLSSDVVYAYLNLYNWNNEFIEELLNNISAHQEYMIETLSYAHDNGTEIPNL